MLSEDRSSAFGFASRSQYETCWVAALRMSACFPRVFMHVADSIIDGNVLAVVVVFGSHLPRDLLNGGSRDLIMIHL